jgi:hypothetical protein
LAHRCRAPIHRPSTCATALLLSRPLACRHHRRSQGHLQRSSLAIASISTRSEARCPAAQMRVTPPVPHVLAGGTRAAAAQARTRCRHRGAPRVRTWLRMQQLRSRVLRRTRRLHTHLRSPRRPAALLPAPLPRRRRMLCAAHTAGEHLGMQQLLARPACR